MPWCGFNQQMLEGMKEFHEGLIEAILDIKIEENSSGEQDATVRI